MNTPDQPGNDQLHQQLAARLEHVHASTDLTGPAIARAGRIRRRRHALAATGAAAAVLAVSAPFVWWNLQGTDPTPVPATTTTTTTDTPTSTTSPTPVPTETSAAPTATPSETATAAPTFDSDRRSPVVAELSLSGPIGTPDVAFVTDGVSASGVRILHDGTTETRLDVPADALFGTVLGGLASGGLAVSSLMPNDSEWGLHFLDSSGRTVGHAARANPAVIDSTGTRVVYLDDGADPGSADDALHLLDATGRELASLPGRRFPVGVVGDVVYTNNDSNGTVEAWDTRGDDVVRLGAGRLSAVHGASGSAVLIPEGSTDCFRLVTLEATTLTPSWTSCGQRFSPYQFSPSGAYLVGGAELEGGSPDRRRLLRTSDAAFVLDLDAASEQLTIGKVAFTAAEDAVVVSVSADLAQGLVRCTLDGACEPVAKPLPMDTSHPSGMAAEPYHLFDPAD